MLRSAVTIAAFTTAVAATAAGVTLAPVSAQAAPPAVVATSARVAPDAAATTYVVAARSGATSRLLLVDRTTGVVRRTLATAPELTDGRFSQSPFSQATVGRDGTVWAVRSGFSPYDTSLLRIAAGRVQTFAPYVIDVSVSPDGARVAYAVMSPDTDHDGYGTMSLRVGASSGRGPQTVLASHRFRVDRSGTPVGLVDRYDIVGWADARHVVVAVGSQDEFARSVVAVDKVVPRSRWARYSTSYDSTALGYDRAGRLLMVRPVLRGDVVTGLAVDAITAASGPAGTHVTTVPCPNGSTAQLAAWARRTGVRVTDAGVVAPPLRGVTGVDAVYLPR